MGNIQCSLEIGPGVINYHWHGERSLKVLFQFANKAEALAMITRIQMSLNLAEDAITKINLDPEPVANPMISLTGPNGTERPPPLAELKPYVKPELHEIFPPGDERLGLGLTVGPNETFTEVYTRRAASNMKAWSHLTPDEQKVVLEAQTEYLRKKGEAQPS